MLGSILASGLAMGAIYALIGVTYNTMFSASRVMSFTAGQLGMLGGVFGSLFVLRLGMPMPVGLLMTLALCALVGLVTEVVAVRPVLKSLDQHLYVLSTLALAFMIQQSTAILWSTEPQRSPRTISLPGRSACRSETCAWRATHSPGPSAGLPDSRAVRCCSRSSPTATC